MTKFTRILTKKAERQRKYFADPLKYAKKVKQSAAEFLPQVKIYLFGSTVYGKALPGSDVDLLVVSPRISKKQLNQAKIKAKLYQAVGLDSPLEIHLTTQEGFLWYKRFAKKLIEI